MILKIHRGLNRHDARNETLKLFQSTRLPEPAQIYQRYPHQLSAAPTSRYISRVGLSAVSHDSR